MHVVSDLQQRPRKSRLWTEKKISGFYDLCSVIQLTCFLVYTVTVVVLSNQTFAQGIFAYSSFALSSPLQAKLLSCTYQTTRSMYAFYNVTVELSTQNVNDIFVDEAIQLRLGVFIGATALVLGVINRAMVDQNFFKLKFHNLYLWKDTVSATELMMLGYLCQIAIAAHTPASLLSDYLVTCNVRLRNYLPFMNSACLWVIAGVGFFSYLVGLIVYLALSLPKYGIMSSGEIEEYKNWLRERRARAEHSRALLEEAKRAHARWQWANFASPHDAAAAPGEEGRLGGGESFAKHSFMPSEMHRLNSAGYTMPAAYSQPPGSLADMRPMTTTVTRLPMTPANLSFASSQPPGMNYRGRVEPSMVYGTRLAASSAMGGE